MLRVILSFFHTFPHWFLVSPCMCPELGHDGKTDAQKGFQDEIRIWRRQLRGNQNDGVRRPFPPHSFLRPRGNGGPGGGGVQFVKERRPYPEMVVPLDNHSKNGIFPLQEVQAWFSLGPHDIWHGELHALYSFFAWLMHGAFLVFLKKNPPLFFFFQMLKQFFLAHSGWKNYLFMSLRFLGFALR